MLQGAREDGENMRNSVTLSLSQIFITFTLSISQHPRKETLTASGLQCKHWTKITAVSPLHAGNGGGIRGSLSGIPRAPRSGCGSKRVCASNAPAREPAPSAAWPRHSPPWPHSSRESCTLGTLKIFLQPRLALSYCF